MIIANATGCSSIWASSGAATAYTKNQQGYGPAWANSLFEDNAEYGLGMFLGTKTIRERIASNIEKALKEGACNSALLRDLNGSLVEMVGHMILAMVD